ncbi:hypothetical protein Ddye_007684 [Dipteronia dyeriana]|uniref:Endonuclease/exonuclease/phosphatase domain-containing protein n=1 Tax=Dipteronia dyeriana TaxID=168575 RepID=A0AAE0CRX1_9ROSI|nr:hypothetical protein Ddye_007684 [Dipteronia dyeriana]
MRVLRDLCHLHRPSLVCIVEPMVVFTSISSSLWSSLSLHLMGLNDRGGLLPTIWVFACDSFPDAQIILFHEKYLTVSITVNSQLHYFTFIYTSMSTIVRRSLWQSLRNMVSLVSSSWLVVGDFNMVLGDHESLSLHPPACSSCDEDFKSVIDDCDLIGVRSQSARFTWARGHYPHTRVWRRLDRALVSEGSISCWRDISYVALHNRFSDHFPLVIRLSDIVNVSPTPFRFQSIWLDHPDFMALVRHIWSSSSVGNPPQVVINKLKRLKNALKTWN